VSDENSAGGAVSQPAAPAPAAPAGGAFDWLVESHQQSAPMAPLTDDVPSPAVQPHFDFPNPASAPVAPAWYPAQQQPTTVVQAPPPISAPILQPAPTAAPAVQPPPQAAPAVQPQFFSASPERVSEPSPAARSFVAAASSGGFALERHQTRVRSGNGALDWIAFVLAFLAPPVGLLVGIGAAVADSRNKGFVAAIAKAAIGIGTALSLVLSVAFVVVTKIDNDQAAHNAIVASSRAYCTKLKSNPATLASNTFGWPSPGSTIPASIAAMKTYESSWKSLAAVAPADILAGTRRVESAAAAIVSSVQTTQTLDDANDVAQMQNVVAASGIVTWVSDYCS